MPKYFTPEGLEKLKKELDYLENVKRKEIAKALKVASQQGDLSENAAYEIAKEEQAFLEDRIKELRKIIAQAKVVEKKSNYKVQLASIVTLISEEGEEKYQIVSPEEIDLSKGKISSESPIGKALLGKKKGDEIVVEIGDERIKYRIKEIE